MIGSIDSERETPQPVDTFLVDGLLAGQQAVTRLRRRQKRAPRAPDYP